MAREKTPTGFFNRTLVLTIFSLWMALTGFGWFGHFTARRGFQAWAAPEPSVPVVVEEKTMPAEETFVGPNYVPADEVFVGPSYVPASERPKPVAVSKPPVPAPPVLKATPAAPPIVVEDPPEELSPEVEPSPVAVEGDPAIEPTEGIVEVDPTQEAEAPLVQYGAFSVPENAQSLKEKLELEGKTATIEEHRTESGGVLYRVRGSH